MKIDNRDIFEQIGNLFYAVAVEQGVQPIEAGELKSLISKDWLPRNASEFPVPDETHFILLAIDTLAANGVKAIDAFSQFAKFFAFHSEVFTQEVRQRMLDTAGEITTIFRQDNPGSNAQLEALKNLLRVGKVNA